MYILGDIHGDFNFLLSFIENISISPSSIIQVGDFGIGFEPIAYEKSKLDKVNDALNSKKIHLYVLRGNHDDPYYFKDYTGFHFSNITFVPDYSVLSIEGNNILFIGGAVSIDRAARLRTNDRYWRNEIIREIDLDKDMAKDMLSANVVISHSAPSSFYPYTSGKLTKDIMEEDPYLFQEITKEREYLQKIFDKMKNFNLEAWFYGHFHQHKMEFIDDIKCALVDQKKYAIYAN